MARDEVHRPASQGGWWFSEQAARVLESRHTSCLKEGRKEGRQSFALCLEGEGWSFQCKGKEGI